MANIPEDGPIALSAAKNIKNENKFYNSFLKAGTAGVHKSLDFSNVGYYNDTNADPTEDGRKYRQFHQTRIYIQGLDTFGGIYSHGEAKKDSTFLISANLPELVNYRIGSDWTNPLSGLGGPLLSTLSGLLKSGLSATAAAKAIPASLYNRFQTVQMWSGTKPLNMSITIPVIDDPHSATALKQSTASSHANFAEALEFLGSLCLPNKVERESAAKKPKELSNHFGFYVPPPSPLKINAFWNGTTTITNEKGEDKTVWERKGPLELKNANYARIMIQLGGMLLIDNCIITGLSVQYNNTKSLIRHYYNTQEHDKKNELDYLTPMLAEVTINFSTIEALTASDYSKMLWLKRQKDVGTGAVSSIWVQEHILGQTEGKEVK